MYNVTGTSWKTVQQRKPRGTGTGGKTPRSRSWGCRSVHSTSAGRRVGVERPQDHLSPCAWSQPAAFSLQTRCHMLQWTRRTWICLGSQTRTLTWYFPSPDPRGGSGFHTSLFPSREPGAARRCVPPLLYSGALRCVQPVSAWDKRNRAVGEHESFQLDGTERSESEKRFVIYRRSDATVEPAPLDRSFLQVQHVTLDRLDEVYL
ncbi:uncharacterized protein LOC120794458 [Xiphias gladius]|uniref:uncharacterized protein LOC120794458 n=1 Tax=Xiphias gladius TaxID=8245 RepID=UPI001A97F230|nr:uncharacterized protein LOC120794458 [Xiphias gladius]